MNHHKYLIKLAASPVVDALNDLGKASDIVGSKSPINTASSLKVLKFLGAGMIAAFAVNAILEVLKTKVIEPRRYKKLFEEMLEKHPSLLKEDAQEVAELWYTFYKTSPTLAEDPIAAGAWITQMIQKQVRSEFGGPTMDVYESLGKIEGNLINNKNERKSSIGRFFDSAADRSGVISSAMAGLSALGGI